MGFEKIYISNLLYPLCCTGSEAGCNVSKSRPWSKTYWPIYIYIYALLDDMKNELSLELVDIEVAYIDYIYMLRFIEHLF